MRILLVLAATVALLVVGTLTYVRLTLPPTPPDPFAPWEPPPGFVYPTSSTAPPSTTTIPTTTTTTPPVASTTTTRMTAPPSQPRQDAAGACAAAIARNRAPLAPGASERCSSPVYSWGATNGAGTIFYSSEKVAAFGASEALWDYVVAHERDHARRVLAGDPTWTDEAQADRGAARYYPAAVARWSPRR